MPTIFSPTHNPLSSLRRRWEFFALASLCLLAGGYLFLAGQWEPGYAQRWLVLSSLFSVYLLWVFWHSLPNNIRPGEMELLPALGPGNVLTLLRGLLIAGLVGFLFSPRPTGWQAWIPGLFYTLAALLDYLDGWAARASGYTTRLGEQLDLSLDGVGVFTAALLAVQYGQAPWFYLAVALARPVFLICLWLWQRAGHPVYALPRSHGRRAFAGLQMGFLFFILWPLFSPPATHLAAALVALPFLAGFIRDGMFALGLLRPSPQPARLLSQLTRLLPVPLRLTAVGLVYVHLILHSQAGSLGLLESLEILVAFLLLFGTVGRLAAILGLLLLGFYQIFTPLSPLQTVLAGVYVSLLYLGTGALSLWRPEDRLITRRAGERPVAGPLFTREA